MTRRRAIAEIRVKGDGEMGKGIQEGGELRDQCRHSRPIVRESPGYSAGQEEEPQLFPKRGPSDRQEQAI